MTTKKLSDLPAAAPILGTETVFGLQSGFSVQIPYGSFNGITTTGNVGIGTSSPSSKLDVSGGYISTANTQLAVGNILSTTASLVAGNWYRIATFPASNQGQTVDITVRLGNTHNNTIIKVAKGTGQWRAEAYRAGYYVNPAANAGYPAINKVRIYDIGVNNVTHIDIQIAGNTSSLTYNVIVDKNTSDIGTNRITLVALTDQGTASAGVEFQAIGTLASWGNNNGQLVTFDESGNVGIGCTPSSLLSIQKYNPAGLGPELILNNSGNGVSDSMAVTFASGAIGSGARGQIKVTVDNNPYYGIMTFSRGSSTATLVESMRIDSSGNVLVGTTSSADPIAARINGVHVDGGTKAVYSRSTSAWELGMATTSGNNINFYTDNGTAYVEAGSIASNGSVTAFNVTSDYRLKQSITPLQNSLSKVMQLNPCSYEYIEGNQYFEGFIAHELQTIVPICVTGEKDKVDADGKPIYQSVDTSKLVATLTAAIQELKAIIDMQQEQINSLLGK